ncbi:MAG: PAS domain S-box protein [Deltaproteobacteria bacterium]|nr:PAS domain S-box protein [Deltaproteobacteria bacterium]MBN2671407.1 PAS domain S-box protein [Deltaproteobacteria bacterium]
MSDKLMEHKPPTVADDDNLSLASAEEFQFSEEDAHALTAIFAMLQTFSAVDFSQYRRTTVVRRLNRRLGLNRISSIAQYQRFLEAKPDELKLLYSDLLLSFTHFFRDSYIFDALKEKVFPRLVAQRSAKSPIRIWVPGCSTGEEVYSMAIALYEFLEDTGSTATAQFFGTDLVEENIVRARSGVYTKKITEQVDERRLSRFFDTEPGGYRVTKTIREMCVFATQDITKDPPFPNIDVVSCRNVLIYFNDKFQDVVFPLFHFALKPDGYLVLGSSETISRLPQLFTPLDSRANIYQKRGASSSVLYRLPFYQASDRSRTVPSAASPDVPQKKAAENLLHRVNSTLVKTFSPPGVLVDNNLIIRQFIGQPFPFIVPNTGEASLKLAKMANEALLPDLYVSVEECRKTNETVIKQDVHFASEHASPRIDITVIPFNEDERTPSFLILFSQKDVVDRVDGDSDFAAAGQEDSLQKMKQELRVTKNHLQAIIEEKDEVNLELWAANEEVQSTNEELQSVNEEMEAAKEELESSNEELMALNEELQLKNIEISEREQQLRELFDNMTDGFASLRMIYNQESKPVDYEFVEVNEVFACRYGMTPERLAGRTVKSILPETELYWIERFAAVAETGVPDHFTSYDKDTDRHFETRLYRPKQGFCAAIFADVTETVRSQQALKNSEEKFKSYIEWSPHGIFVADENGCYVEVNEGACRITEYSSEELTGLSLFQLIHPDDSEAAKEHFTQTRLEGSASGEFRFVTKHGRQKYCQVDAVKLSESRYLGIASDRTDNHMMQQQMQQSEKMRAVGQLAGGVAHDFNNQLSGILGFSDLLVDEVNDCPNAKKYVESIIASVKRSADLTSQLLAFSRKGKYLDVTVDIHREIDEVITLFEHSIDKRIQIERFFNALNPRVKGDPTQLQNAILDLAINARDAMPQGGVLRFKTDDCNLDAAYCEAQSTPLVPGAYVSIQVEDTGVGMSEEIQSRLFEPFFTTKGQGKGVGMGLAATYGTVKNHKGAIQFASAVGSGTTFTILLPAETDQVDILETPPEVIIPPVEAHVLFVDDDDIICELAETILRSLGYQVSVCRNGAEALRFYERNWRSVDLVVLDMVMPIMTGKDAFIAMKAINPNIIVVVSSGYSVSGEAQELLEMGAADFIQKPFRKGVFAQKLSQLLLSNPSSSDS